MSLATESDKWIKAIDKVDNELCDTMENMDNDELKQRVLQSQMNLLENDRQRKEDDKLSKAKIKHDNLKAPYDEAKKFQTAIVNYGVLLLEQRGVSLTED